MGIRVSATATRGTGRVGNHGTGGGGEGPGDLRGGRGPFRACSYYSSSSSSPSYAQPLDGVGLCLRVGWSWIRPTSSLTPMSVSMKR
ncbi:hypothetical protein COCNU_08G009610 [Cocos nucifera]|uniref:Uncharacterized protein n=1 Tax=Cocos nucifera TaxID=13894 RepID=A0A8K0IJ39_COCNU|nr:hypothetical protein COCNU_08G009610 [Cocos nucifera]